MANEKFMIIGKKALSGNIKVGGAKNDALILLASSLLTKRAVTVGNVPQIEDVRRIIELLRSLGAIVDGPMDRTVKVTAATLTKTVLDGGIAKNLRASVVLTGPLLARCGEVSFPHPGGCVIGERPIDVFLKGYEAMGATVETGKDLHRISAKGGLRGAHIFFPVVSVTGTETLMMAAVLARGTTVLKNAAMEPEVISLATFLNSCGARISGHGTPIITIEGIDELSGGACTVIPDRIEAGSFAMLAAATRSRFTITDCEPGHLDAPFALLQYAGVHIDRGERSFTVDATETKEFASRNLTTHEYPGFSTDLQAPAVVFLTQCAGESRVHETIFEGRLNWTGDLVRMGAAIDIADPHRIFVHGPTPLRGKNIHSPDLRAGMAFIIAALAAEGKSELHNIYQIDRGYERIEERLRALGADIQRVTAD